MYPDQPAQAVCLQTVLQVEKLKTNSMDPDQTARMLRLVWINAGRKPIGFVTKRLILILFSNVYNGQY
jgi:hypothetical protein